MRAGPHVHLDELVGALAGAAAWRGPAAVPDVTSVVHDTRDVTPGALFCCVRGSKVDGHDLAEAAVTAGAVALVVDHELPQLATVPQVVVPNVREAMGPLAARFWRERQGELTVIGVTGTAGKTTVTHLLQAILTTSGRSTGLIGTLSGVHTTPEATELQAQLAAESAAGRESVVMEVSSHGLGQHRVDGTRFAVAVFTNLSRDHLDFHHTMDEYFAAKARLFEPVFTDQAVVCVDDPWGRRLFDDLSQRDDLTTVPYSLDDVRDLDVRTDGCSFRWEGVTVHVGLPGRFNALNALAAAVTAKVLGVDADTIAAGLAAAVPPAGRFEPVDSGQPFTVLVDYSHKPDALEQALVTSRELAPKGQVTVVFGCGGDRDATKRPIMGEVAARLADAVVLTSDNPRSEDPLAIIDEVRAGIPAERRGALTVEPDRRAAIVLAIGRAEPGDLVLVAGKGHETTQTIGDLVLPFDDRVEVRNALTTLGYES